MAAPSRGDRGRKSTQWQRPAKGGYVPVPFAKKRNKVKGTDVPCPTCKVDIEVECVTLKDGSPTKIHPSRVRMKTRLDNETRTDAVSDPTLTNNEVEGALVNPDGPVCDGCGLRFTPLTKHSAASSHRKFPQHTRSGNKVGRNDFACPQVDM